MDQRVLVIDDDPPTRLMIAAVLSHEEFAVDVCEDSQTAIECLNGANHRVIVLALVERNPTGDTEFLLHLRERQPAPCVVVLSAGSQDRLDAVQSDLVRARLRKPFHIDDLVSAVRGCFEAS